MLRASLPGAHDEHLFLIDGLVRIAVRISLRTFPDRTSSSRR